MLENSSSDSTLQFCETQISLASLPLIVNDLELLPLLTRKLLELKLTSSIKPSQDDQVKYQRLFMRQNNIQDEESLAKWLDSSFLTQDRLTLRLYRQLQVEIFKHQKFQNNVESYFLDNKEKLDKVIYSLIRVKESPKASEIYLRIEQEEQTFSQLASEYAEGNEKDVNGLIGPVELGNTNPHIAERLRISQQGQLWEPFRIDNWWIVLRLEKHLPAVLDGTMKKKIIDLIYENWLFEKVRLNVDQFRKEYCHNIGSKGINNSNSNFL